MRSTQCSLVLRLAQCLCTSVAVSQPGLSEGETTLDVVKRQRRDTFDANGVRYDRLNTHRDRRDCRKRFDDPFRFGSSDRFSHGFGKRHISNSAATASVCLLFVVF